MVYTNVQLINIYSLYEKILNSSHNSFPLSLKLNALENKQIIKPVVNTQFELLVELKTKYVKEYTGIKEEVNNQFLKDVKKNDVYINWLLQKSTINNLVNLSLPLDELKESVSNETDFSIINKLSDLLLINFK